MLNFKEKLKGFTIIEVMVALVVNLLMFAGLIVLFGKNIQQYKTSTSTNKLDEELTNALSYMSGEISRAGYWANARNDIGTGQNNNPFMTTATDITLSSTNDCIHFTYDMDSNGLLSNITSSNQDDRVGFRLKDAAIQARVPGAAFDCDASATEWENITDPTFTTITNLTFTPSYTTINTGTGSTGLVIRAIDISISGIMKNDSTVNKTVSQHVRIKNDKFIP